MITLYMKVTASRRNLFADLDISGVGTIINEPHSVSFWESHCLLMNNKWPITRVSFHWNDSCGTKQSRECFKDGWLAKHCHLSKNSALYDVSNFLASVKNYHLYLTNNWIVYSGTSSLQYMWRNLIVKQFANQQVCLQIGNSRECHWIHGILQGHTHTKLCGPGLVTSFLLLGEVYIIRL